jgi:hypothetical protein
MAGAATANNNSSNNQMVCELPSAHQPHSSSMKTGIIARLMGAMSATTTPVQTRNPQATRTNTMGGLLAGMHKTILPSALGRAPPVACAPMKRLAFQAAWRNMPPPNFTAMMAPV